MRVEFFFHKISFELRLIVIFVEKLCGSWQGINDSSSFYMILSEGMKVIGQRG